MVVENVDIRFRESGSVVIKRKIDEIGQSANRATRGLFLLQRALFVLGAAGGIAQIVRLSDALTSMENRLRLTAFSTDNLRGVQDRLSEAAIRSRTDFLALGEIYTRMALSARDLGASQQEILEFTETLSKASIISGANAQEARAALIQLGQGLASDRLSGDELRSILEQLPFVADIIARDIGVTRGQLRQLGSDGELTAQVVLDAFRNARDEINALFETTNITISQALANAQTRLLQFIVQIERFTGASNKIARGIDSLSRNMDILFVILSLVVAKLAVAFTVSIVQRIMGIVSSIQRLGSATAVLTSIESKRAANSVALTASISSQSAAELRSFQIRQARIAQTLVLRQAEFTEAAAAFQNGRARDLQTGKFITNAAARDRLTQATIRLSAAERANQIATARLTSLTTASIAADNAATASRNRLASANIAAASSTVALSSSFPLLTGALRLVRAAFIGLFVIMAANPIGATIAILATLAIALVGLGNRIRFLSGGIVGLRDLFVAAFQIMGEALAPIVGPVWESIVKYVRIVRIEVSRAVEFMGRSILQAAEMMIDAFTFIPRVFAGTISGIIEVMRILPAEAGNVAASLANAMIAGFESMSNHAIEAINAIIRGLNRLLSMVGGDRALEWFGFSGQVDEIIRLDLPRLEVAAEGSGRRIGDAFTSGFTSTFEAGEISNVIEQASELLAPIGQRIAERAIRNTQDAAKNASVTVGDRAPSDPSDPSDASGGNREDFASQLANLQRAIELERQYGIQKEITNKILEVENALKRTLTATERQQIATSVELLEVARMQGEILESIRGPQERLILGQRALNELFAQGQITLGQFNDRLREMEISADSAANTLSGGFRAAIGRAIMSTGEFGEALGNTVVNAANSAADAVVEFARTGQFNIRALFADLFAQLLKLVTQRLFMNILGGLFGIRGSGFQFAGAFDSGGHIPRNQVGLVGENGPELVRGPAMVTSRAETARRMEGQGSSPEVNIYINAQGAVEGVASQINEAINKKIPEIVKAASAYTRERTSRGY